MCETNSSAGHSLEIGISTLDFSQCTLMLFSLIYRALCTQLHHVKNVLIMHTTHVFYEEYCSCSDKTGVAYTYILYLLVS